MQKRSTFVESMIQAVKLPLIFLVVLTMSISQAFANLAFVTNFTSGTVSVIDTSTNLIVGSPITVGTSPEGITISPDGKFAYVANSGSNSISVIDTSANPPVVTTTINGVGGSPRAIVITPDGMFAYVVNNILSGTVTKINLSSNTVVTGIGYPIHVGGFPNGIAITPDGSHLYVTNNQSPPSVSVIQTSTDMVSNTISVSPASGSFGIALTPGGNFVYVANTNSNNVSVIQTSSNTIFGSPITVGSAPQGVAITPNGNFVYVSNFGSTSGTTVSVIQTSNNTVVGPPITVGTGPRQIAITPDGLFAYVANFTSNNVSVINTATNLVVQTIMGIGGNPWGIAITPTITPPPPPPSSPSSPKNLTGEQQKNDFGLVFELYNTLQWDESSSSSVVGYFVYRNGSKIASLDASTLEYQDHNRKKGARTVYSVTAFDAAGNESAPINVTIK